MDKDLIIGGASNYTYQQLKPWIRSIKESGFEGDIAIVGTNIKTEELEKIAQEGVNLLLYGRKTETGEYVSNGAAPHVERFFYIWNYLDNVQNKYRYVITTDTRDVIFQRNPILWLEAHLNKYDFVASSEGMLYKDEPWSARNLHEAFGPFFYEKLKNRYIYNVGTIAGQYETVRDLLLMIFQLSMNRPIPIVDQAVYNFLLNIPSVDHAVNLTDNDDGWAIQLGTTAGAIEAGMGDLGLIAKQNPSKLTEYYVQYMDIQPTIVDGVVLNTHNEPFYIVHQYDRVPELNKLILEKYA
jgi:hypothetical protein